MLVLACSSGTRGAWLKLVASIAGPVSGSRAPISAFRLSKVDTLIG